MSDNAPTEAAFRRFSVKKLLWKFSKNSQKNFTEIALHQECFPANFPKIFK